MRMPIRNGLLEFTILSQGSFAVNLYVCDSMARQYIQATANQNIIYSFTHFVLTTNTSLPAKSL